MTLRKISAQELVNEQMFSPDGGFTWYICAVPQFGTVAVYVDDRRDPDEPCTRRVVLNEDEMVWVHELSRGKDQRAEF